MALIKEKTLPNGVTLEYWKIASIKQNFLSGRSEVQLNGYIDKAARIANKDAPVSKQVVMVTLNTDDDLRAQAYEKAKTAPVSNFPSFVGGESQAPFFADAEDD